MNKIILVDKLVKGKFVRLIKKLLTESIGYLQISTMPHSPSNLSPILPSHPQLCSRSFPHYCSSFCLSSESQQAFPGKLQDTPSRKAGRLTVNFHLSFLSSKSTPIPHLTPNSLADYLQHPVPLCPHLQQITQIPSNLLILILLPKPLNSWRHSLGTHQQGLPEKKVGK